MTNDDLQQQLLVEIGRDLTRREQAGERVQVELGPGSAWLLMGLCQRLVAEYGPGDPRSTPIYELGRDLAGLFDGAAGDAAIASWNQLFDEIERRRSE